MKRSAAFLVCLCLGACLSAPAIAAAGPSEDALLSGINALRAEHGLPGLTRDPGLDRLAQAHSRDMERAGVLSHEGFDERFERSGSDLCVENVGWNAPDAPAQVRGWDNSPGHRRNLLDPGIRRAGLGRAGAYATFIGCR